MYIQNRKRLGELLIDSGILTRTQLEDLLLLQKTSGKKLGELLIEEGITDEQQIVEILEFQLKIPKINFDVISIEPEIPTLISESLARKYTLIPIYKEASGLTVAMSDPLDLSAIDELGVATGLEIKPAIAVKSAIVSAIERYYGRESAERAVEDFKKEYNFEQISEADVDIANDVNNSPVVRLVNSIIQHAMKLGASDIHLEPLENSLRVRFRIDGELQEIMKATKEAHSAVVTRIKIMGLMDIAEKRQPQDGRVEMKIAGKDIDLRISILPTIHGEKVVIRLLGRSDMMVSKEKLGFSPENIETFEKLIKTPNGIILVTGPTGSGKTTTLYAALKELNEINRNIITVEDPVEYRLEGINQVQVNNKAGLTFANGLRSILRQDPDVIMIGEIRDIETAQIAVRAAITGHLVLSTIHTNDSASTISRLVDMGVDPYMVSSSVVGIISQRLVKKICIKCKKPYQPSISELTLLEMKEVQTLYKGQGCNACGNTGYRGRTAIHEIMVINKEIRELIDRKATVDQLRYMATYFGTTTLRECCADLVLSGITTTEELIRMTYTFE